VNQSLSCAGNRCTATDPEGSGPGREGVNSAKLNPDSVAQANCEYFTAVCTMAPKEHLTIRVMSAGVRNSARSLIDAVKHLGPKGTERPARTAQPKTDIGHRNL